MAFYRLKVLGCDNGSGKMEVGGDLDHNRIVAGDHPINIGRAVADLMLEPGVGVSEIKVSEIGGHHIVTFEAEGCAFVVCATKEPATARLGDIEE